VLPRDAAEVRLISRAAAPTDLRPWLEDRRRQGVYVERIILRGRDEMRETPVDHSALVQGWWAVEGSGRTLRRWTDGDGVLPLPVMEGPMTLKIRASNGGMAYTLASDLPDPVTAAAAHGLTTDAERLAA
jgi:hypothetical protein